MLQNLSSAAVVIGALRVKRLIAVDHYINYIYRGEIAFNSNYLPLILLLLSHGCSRPLSLPFKS